MAADEASIYIQCGEAARMLLDDPSLRYTETDFDKVFTELDVIFLAAKRAGEYSEEEMREAQREASQIMGTLFRNGQVVRFGPVCAPGMERPDYARIDSKILYASADTPALTTPNGVFPPLLEVDDPIKRRGRGRGTGRNDLAPWPEDIAGSRAPKGLTADKREIIRLEAENASLREQLTRAQAENHRLREHNAGPPTRARSKKHRAA